MVRLWRAVCFPMRYGVRQLSRCNVRISFFSILAFVCFSFLFVLDFFRLPLQQMRHADDDLMVGSMEMAYDLRKNNFKLFANCTLRSKTPALFSPDTNFLHQQLRHRDPRDPQVCVHPALDPCDPEVAEFYEPVKKVTCSPDPNWVYVDNGTFRISQQARNKYGKITCEYAPLFRGNDDFSARQGGHIKPMLNGTPLVTDFFKVACISPSGKKYHNIHAGVAYAKSLHNRARQVPLPKKALGYSVLMFGFDSTSYLAWLRNLPKSRDFFVRHLGGIELKGYNIIGDGTVQALLPILTGKMESDLPTARRGEAGAVSVDDFPWIWNNFRDAGYVTSWAEDMAGIGTFQYRLNGFKKQPTDHSMRTYFLLSEAMHGHHRAACLGSMARHTIFVNWFKDLYRMYGQKPKFMFGFHSEFSHGDSNKLRAMDDELLEFLRFLDTNGHLNSTILILMSDHGARFSNIRSTTQGKLEERMPYFSFRIPPALARTRPDIIKNLQLNSQRLVTPYDIHATFHDILTFSDSYVRSKQSKGISLFREIPKNRSCEDADVEPHWCACLDWESVNPLHHPNVSKAVMDFINSLTRPYRHVCALLGVLQILKLDRLVPNAQVMKFVKSADRHGDVPKFNETADVDVVYFQVTLQTSPGNGLFEVTVKHSTNGGYSVTETEISRTNRYGDDPKCIAKERPDLRPYCYCLR